MTNRRSLCLCWRSLALLAFGFGAGHAAPLGPQATTQQEAATQQASTPEPTTESIFADSPFDKWQTERPRQEVPWEVRMSADRLSFHQRLIANIQVQISGPELLKRSHDERIVLLVQVINGQGVSFRDYGLLELDKLKPEVKGSDVEFAWQAFALPGQYEVSVALWDKKSGEHNFLRRLFHVGAYRNDPLPEMWRGLDAFEFWSTKRDGPEFMFHSDIEGRLHLPLATRRPVHLEVLLDMSPSAEIFRGSFGYYNNYLAVALPMFKVFSQITPSNGSRSAAALDLIQRRIPFEQNDGKDVDWQSLRKALSADNGPGTVSVKNLQNRRQSPVYLREEILRRLKAADGPAMKPDEKPLHVFVLIGTPMDMYVFPKLPEMEPGNEEDCVIYYLQSEFVDRHGINGAVGNVEKMLKPLKIRSFRVESADDVRHALAKIMEEVGRL
jgi:hypothetical protein